MKEYSEIKELEKKIEEYEQEQLEEYHALDLHRSKIGLYGKNQPLSFNDLTLEENLNYVKHDIKNSRDAFRLYEVTN